MLSSLDSYGLLIDHLIIVRGWNKYVYASLTDGFSLLIAN
jgi:hypothetical protein